MTVHSVTLDLPSTLYSRVEQRAARTQRSVEEELLDVLASALPASEELSETEAAETARLVRQYERAMLIRARAATLLQQRGHNVSSLHAGE